MREPTRREVEQAIRDGNVEVMRLALLGVLDYLDHNQPFRPFIYNEWRGGFITGLMLTIASFLILHYLGYF